MYIISKNMPSKLDFIFSRRLMLKTPNSHSELQTFPGYGEGAGAALYGR